MMRSDGTVPAAQFVAALLAGKTVEQAYGQTYLTPELHSTKRSSSDGQQS